MKNKHVGFLVIGIAVLIFFLVMSFNNALETIVSMSCTHGVSCPMQVTLDTQKQISYGLVALLVVLGGVVSFFLKDGSKNLEKPKLSNQPNLENLDEAERIIMNIVLRENGSVYQSDLIKETKQSKVKVSRVLDKLEGKGLIERKRRGMTNIIILK
ncbi:MarR family transcriptional regulator [Candidatus Woesearchaeota archaeon]|jgi:hypothetical protein|nr:MarR family transcriptional regulator [Candidatus Woesearchaeota archaeon]MBT4151119.1 MarR family transcriptional regulator [Candidatus Woesearchaeota archaeon]MBT4247937.1 MarR family transcriptional regulator [Candidatus Woesearchaeota archaeon]MBT4433924.1 MarR family transcriptional regulator [Candidatus Woesearchaeota archaeon]MBT7332029.1 MarR family transcriptional regulator [Candidatus Woesearchaeota archaeon]